VLVDTLGMLLAVVVHSANIQDRDGAKLVFFKIRHLFTKLKLIWADGGYRGKLIEWVDKFFTWKLEIVHKEAERKFVVLPKRWIVERTFAWLNTSRRLSKDYELLTTSSESWIYLSMIRLMVARLAPT
jgi:putative transposase